MNTNTTITLDQFYAAVMADIKEAFPAYATVEFDREDRTNIPLPAVLLEVSGFEDDSENDPGTGQWQANARVEAYVILNFREDQVKLNVRMAATALALWLRMRRFKHPIIAGKALPTGAVRLVEVQKDDFTPELDQYEVWRIEWMQSMQFGVSLYAGENDGVTPGHPLYSWAPEIGNGHAEDYSEALPPTPTPTPTP